MTETAVIIQPFGLGDNIFTITICNLLIQDGYHVIYPTQPHFVEGLQRAYPQIEWVDCNKFKADYNCKEDKVINGLRHIPLRWSDGWNGTPYRDCMANKYRMYNLDWQTWKDGAMWQRDKWKEKELIAKIGLPYDLDTEYCLINSWFGSDMNKREVNIITKSDLRTFRMSATYQYSLFDWATIIENATEIHTVSTSIIYLLEMLDLKAKEVHLYNRTIAGQGFETVDYILQRHKYVFHK